MILNKHKIISYVPFAMLVLTLLSGLLSSTEFYIKYYYHFDNLFSYSIVTNLVFMFIYFRKSFCVETKIAVSGLMFMNVLAIILETLTMDYDATYDVIICSVVLFLSLVTCYNRC